MVQDFKSDHMPPKLTIKHLLARNKRVSISLRVQYLALIMR